MTLTQLAGLDAAKHRTPEYMPELGRKLARYTGWTQLAGLIILITMLLLRVMDPLPLSGLRLASFDFYQQLHPRPYETAPVTILDIDDASLEELGQWPWPRSRLADLVDAAETAGSTALAFDIVFAEPDRLSPGRVATDNPELPDLARRSLTEMPDNDALLAAAFARSRVVAGQTSLRRSEAPQSPTGPALQPLPHALIGGDPRPWLLTFPRAIRNLPALENAAVGQGVFSVRPDADGIYRRVPVALVVENQFRLGLAPELLRVASGGAPFAIRTNTAGVEGVVLARQLVPTDRDGTVWPWLSSPEPTRYVSAADLLAGRIPEGRMKDQLVLVGTSAIGLEDFRPTPLGISMAGVEIHAQVLENILSDSLLVRPNYAIGAELALGATLGLVLLLAAPLIPALWLSLGSVILVGGVAALSYGSFVQERLLLDATWPLLTILILFLTMSTGNYLREEQRRRRIRSAFGQYVSPELVTRLSESEDALTLGGETRELTLLFSDMRGFTEVSEAYKEDPQGLTELMNTLLTALSDPILAEGGTIDKFMGDAVMAFWNAPLSHPTPAKAACKAALAMQAGVARLNAKHETEADTRKAHAAPLRIGLGVNTGMCVVGNMGSAARFDYTALGDAVNLASRLEGQAKVYGVDIVLGDSTCRAVEGGFATLELDLIRVKGKSDPERIHALLGDATLAQTSAFEALHHAAEIMRSAFRRRDWHAAHAAADKVQASAAAAGLNLDGLAELYRARTAELQQTPPADDWDGVFTAQTK